MGKMSASDSIKFHQHQIESAWRLSSWASLDRLVSDEGSSLSIYRNQRLSLSSNSTVRTSIGSTTLNGSSTASAGAAAAQQSQPIITPTIGFILSALHSENAPFLVEHDMENNILDVRTTYLAPLMAALHNNAFTAYGSAYASSLVPIHTFHDVQHFVSTIYPQLLQNTSMNSFDRALDGGGGSSGSAHSPTCTQLKLELDKLLRTWKARNRLLPRHSLQRAQIAEVQRALISLMHDLSKRKFPETKGIFTAELFRYHHGAMKDALARGDVRAARLAQVDAVFVLNEAEQAAMMVDKIRLSEEQSLNFLLDSARVMWANNDKTGRFPSVFGRTRSRDFIRF